MMTMNKSALKKETVKTAHLSIGYKKSKGAKIIAENINTSLFSGELTCLIGENGVGKSTLLKTMSSFIPCISGNILINGKEIDKYSEKELSKLIGVVLTERCNVKNMSARDLVAMGRSPYTGFWGKENKEDKEIVKKAIEVVGIENLCDRMAETLSDGERQKVMIAKVLAQQTTLIFLDEPTAYLDFPSKVEVMKLLNRISREQNKTIFMSTHDLELALQIADRIWLMDKSYEIRTGTPEDLSLQGIMGTFFSDKGINFDMESGLFRVTNVFHQKIKLKGHGQKYAMIRKALQRNRIEASRNVESENFIETGDLKSNEIIIMFSKEDPVKVYSIEEMLNVVSQKINRT